MSNYNQFKLFASTWVIPTFLLLVIWAVFPDVNQYKIDTQILVIRILSIIIGMYFETKAEKALKATLAQKEEMIKQLEVELNLLKKNHKIE